MTPEKARRHEGTEARRGFIASTLRAFVPSCLCAFLIACQPAKDAAAPPSAPVLSTSEIREGYNRRVEKIERLWARPIVEIRWVDAEGKSHFEQGDGPLIVRKPHDLALAIGKAGNVFMWLGRNAERYWLFELRPPKDQPTTAYVGRIDELDRIDPRKLPLPVRPDQLIELLGITELPDGIEVAITEPPNAGYAVLGPVPGSGARTYWSLDEKLRPTRVGFIDPASGEVIAEAELSNYKPLPITGAPPGAWPDIATTVEIKVPASRANLKLILSDFTDDPAKIKDAQFDFERLVAANKPQQVREITPAGRSQEAGVKRQ